MSTPRVLCLILAALLVCVAAPAFAEEDHDPYDRFGPYVGGGFSYGLDLYEDELEDELGVSVDIDASPGANARVGLRVLSWLAVEAQYEWISEYDVEIGGIGAFEVEQMALTGNLKLYLPFWRLQPYLLAGAGGMRFEAKDKLPGIDLNETDYAWAGRAGAGLDAYLTENLVLFLEGGVVLSNHEIKTGGLTGDDVNGIHYASVQTGLMWRF